MHNKMTDLTPQDEGRALEELIHTALLCIPGIECLREQDIRSKYNDQSLNGVDHMIRKDTAVVLIQDKWKDSSTTQQEVSQFLSCVERIQARCSPQDSFFLIWAGKQLPTSHSTASLRERNVSILNCPFSIEGLARLTILDVCETLGLDPIDSLQKIPVIRQNRTATRPTTREVVSTPTQTPQTYDETDEGKRDVAKMDALISTIMLTTMRKLNNATSNSTVSDSWQLFISAFPLDARKWMDGSFKKIDFNAFLRTMKSLTCPTKTKKFRVQCFFYYCKLRFISVELSSQAAQYSTLRDTMLSKKSAWAKKIPTLKCNPEPMSEPEYRDLIRHCEDFESLAGMGSDGTWLRRSNGYENQFYQHYQVY
jgi:hypothetical protein